MYCTAAVLCSVCYGVYYGNIIERGAGLLRMPPQLPCTLSEENLVPYQVQVFSTVAALLDNVCPLAARRG